MNSKELKAYRKLYEEERMAQPDVLTVVPQEEWPASRLPPSKQPCRVWRSKTFLVQLYSDNGFDRLTVIRALFPCNGWVSEISWDELMLVKRECGYADRWAVECFPPDCEAVNVANMRHLWLLDKTPEFGWKK